MLDYTGVKCPVCERPFQPDDDIVVCPECGAPYHRECYQKEGKCIFDELHAEGKEWQPPAPPTPPAPSAEIKDVECPVCGTLNGHSALFCARCGSSLLGNPLPNDNRPADGTPDPSGTQNNGPAFHAAPPPASYGGYAPPFRYDPMGGVSPAEILDDQVTYGDASRLVKHNTNYYMPVFRYIKQSGRNKFNFSAFLFSGVWMLYRKQYKWGTLVTALMFLLYLFSHAAYAWFYVPTFSALAAEVGIDLNQLSAITDEQLRQIALLAMDNPASYLKLMLPVLVMLAMLVIKIVVGIRGNKMYLKHCVATVRMVKLNQGDGDPRMTLDAQGGVNSMVATCLAICYFVLSTLLPMLIV